MDYFGGEVCGCGRQSKHPRLWVEWITSYLLIILLVVANAQTSLQDSSRFEFVEHPDPFYYAVPRSALIIPCHAEELLDNDARQTVSTTMFVDAFVISVASSTAPADRYLINLDGGGNMIGLIILDVEVEPVPAVVRCSVVRGGEELCNTGNSTIVLGDGRPLPPVGVPYHMMDGFRSVQLQWEASRTPVYAGILNYTVMYWLRDQSRDTAVMATSPDNSTMLELRELAPGSVYSVVVQGTNAIGRGNESAVGEIMTTVGEIPPVPGSVNGIVQETTIRVSWRGVIVDLETTTPVSGYVVSLSNASSPLPALPEDEELEDLDDPSITTHTFTVRQSGVYRVGVASSNLAGRSEFIYSQQELKVSVTTESGSPTLILTIIGVVVAVVSFLVVLIVCLVICYLHLRTKNMETTMQLDESSIESPSLRKKADSGEDREDCAKTSSSQNANMNSNKLASSSAPSMLGGPDLKEDELEDEEKDNWMELLPREGGSGEGRPSARFLRRSLSRDSKC